MKENQLIDRLVQLQNRVDFVENLNTDLETENNDLKKNKVTTIEIKKLRYYEQFLESTNPVPITFTI